MKKFLGFIIVFSLVVLLFSSCTNLAPIPNVVTPNPQDSAAPEIYLENNYGFSDVHYSINDNSAWGGANTVAAFAGDFKGFIVSAANSKINNARMSVLKVTGGRAVDSFVTVYSHSLPLTGGNQFAHDWSSIFTALQPGKYELRVYATDAAGRENYKTFTFYIHEVYISDADYDPYTNPVHTTTDNVTLNVLGLTAPATGIFENVKTGLLNEVPIGVDGIVNLGTLSEGGYNFFIENANGITENIVYSFFVTDAAGPSIAFKKNDESSSEGFTGDGYLKWTILNNGPDNLFEIYYRTSSHTRLMSQAPIFSLDFGGMAAGNAGAITSSNFTANDQRAKIEVIGSNATGNCSAIGSDYFTYHGGSNEWLYLRSTASREGVNTGEEVTIELELKNIKDFGGISTTMALVGFALDANDVTVELPDIATGKNKLEKNFINIYNNGVHTFINIKKAVLNLIDAERKAFTANSTFLRITFTVPNDAVAGLHNVILLDTLIRTFDNSEKGEVRDDKNTVVIVK